MQIPNKAVSNFVWLFSLAYLSVLCQKSKLTSFKSNFLEANHLGDNLYRSGSSGLHLSATANLETASSVPQLRKIQTASAPPVAWRHDVPLKSYIFGLVTIPCTLSIIYMHLDQPDIYTLGIILLKQVPSLLNRVSSSPLSIETYLNPRRLGSDCAGKDTVSVQGTMPRRAGRIVISQI